MYRNSNWKIINFFKILTNNSVNLTHYSYLIDGVENASDNSVISVDNNEKYKKSR